MGSLEGWTAPLGWFVPFSITRGGSKLLDVLQPARNSAELASSP